jgi:hypothetical protein
LFFNKTNGQSCGKKINDGKYFDTEGVTYKAIVGVNRGNHSIFSTKKLAEYSPYQGPVWDRSSTVSSSYAPPTTPPWSGSTVEFLGQGF